VFEAADFLWLAASPDAATPEVIAALRLSLAELSFAYAGLDPDGTLRPADGFPGYLTAAQGDWRVFVPWPLATSFPGPAALAALLAVGTRVAVAPVSSLCISGTSCWLGRDIVVGDLDFCQYLLLAPAGIVTAAAAFVAPRPGQVLLRARYGAHPPAAPPWPDTWPALRAVMEPRTSIDGAERFMIDFLGQHAHFGLLPVSNVVLASDLVDRNRGAAARSFVFQEAVAVPATHEQVRPPCLVDATQIAQYLAFLRHDVAAYAETKPIKAVKRAISLSATIRLPEIAEAGIDILTAPATARYVARKRAAEVAAAVNGCGVVERQMAGGDRTAAPAGGEGDPESDGDVKRVLAEARDLVRQLLSRLDEIEAAMRRPDGQGEHHAH